MGRGRDADSPALAVLLVTRAGYVMMAAVIVAAAVSILLVLRPAGGSHELDPQMVVNYAKFGVIDKIDGNGRTVTVHFRDGFDTEQALGTGSHTFTSEMPDSSSIISMLQQAGVPINTDGGVQLSVQ
jgi:hypothetical protein